MIARRTCTTSYAYKTEIFSFRQADDVNDRCDSLDADDFDATRPTTKMGGGEKIPHTAAVWWHIDRGINTYGFTAQ